MDELTVYAPRILRNAGEICRTFGIGREQLQRWVEEGAPIALERDDKGHVNRYRTELFRLYLWQERRSKRT